MHVSVRSLHASLCFLPWSKIPDSCGEPEDLESAVSPEWMGEMPLGTVG